MTIFYAFPFILSFFFLHLSPLVAALPDPPPQILYSMQMRRIENAFKQYREYYEKLGHHDVDLLQDLGIALLNQGFRSTDRETQFMALVGAGVAANDKVLYILEEGLKNPDPRLQLVSLNLLAKTQNESIDNAIVHLMGSFNPLLRLEALFFMAERKHPATVMQAESLLYKIDTSLYPIIAEIFAMIGDRDGMRNLRKLISHPDEKVRISAILSAAEFGRDDLTPQIRTLSNHLHVSQQEACALALGMLHDEKSIPRLTVLTNSPLINIQIASNLALYLLGKTDSKKALENLAKKKNLIAIYALRYVSGCEDILAQLTQDKELNVRLNATLALLERGDSRSIEGLKKLLIQSPSHPIIYAKLNSSGSALSAWKIKPLGSLTPEEEALYLELSTQLRENCLEKATHLPQKDFLELTQILFDCQQNDLVPALVILLEELGTNEAVNLLKKNQKKIGAPLIRNYCNLALYRLKEPGPWGDYLCEWLQANLREQLIRFRPLVPLSTLEEGNSYSLTAHETSRLLINAFEAFASSQDEKGITALIEAIEKGNEKNRYVLAGLLLRATQ